jgi:poly(3-hydroxybutyrate) depolymerase
MRIILLALTLVGVTQSALANSRCSQSIGWWWSTVISCEHNRQTIEVEEGDLRDVLYQVPLGSAPEEGWPVVFLYQGSYIPVQFNGRSGQSWGGYHQIRLIRQLLDNGFAVIAPEAINRTFWNTNTLAGKNYQSSSDYGYFITLFDMVSDGEFGALNPEKMYASGISSGGYNTSRMAVSFPGKFRALAIQSGSYATCGGGLCNIPAVLPENHPPTLFLHGTKDWIVPERTMAEYAERLYESTVPVYVITDDVGHEWLESAPDEVLSWFLSNP